MKKLFLSLFLIGSLMLTSCSKNSPKTVAEKFMTAVNANNFEEAGKYCDAQTSQLLKSLNELMKSVPSSDAKNEQLFKGFKITKVEENGDKAKVFYTTEDSNGKETALDLKKVDGKWIVSMNFQILPEFIKFIFVFKIIENNSCTLKSCHIEGFSCGSTCNSIFSYFF